MRTPAPGGEGRLPLYERAVCSGDLLVFVKFTMRGSATMAHYIKRGVSEGNSRPRGGGRLPSISSTTE